MLKAYNKLKTKPKAVGEVKKALPVIWSNMPQKLINMVVKDFSN